VEQCEQESQVSALNAEGMSSTISDTSANISRMEQQDEQHETDESTVDEKEVMEVGIVLNSENLPQEPAIVVNTNIQSDVPSTEVEWIECAGQIGSLITHLNKLKNNLESSAIPDPEVFLVETRDMVACCKEINNKA
jgi:hypothetical protein